MANVTSYNEVHQQNGSFNGDDDRSVERYNRTYLHGYHIYEESLNGNLFSGDANLIEKAIENANELLGELKSDFLLSDYTDRETKIW